MYRIIFALIAAVMVLTACNRADTAKDNHDVAVKDRESSQQEKKEIEQTKDEEPKEQFENNTKENENHEKWTSLPEYNKIVEQIQIGSEDYHFQTVTDSEGKRVLHILDKDGRKQYKTIFVKNTNRLKIIKINGGGIIFNGPLS